MSLWFNRKKILVPVKYAFNMVIVSPVAARIKVTMRSSSLFLLNLLLEGVNTSISFILADASSVI